MKNKNLIILLPLIFFIADRLTKYLAFTLPEQGIFFSPEIGLKLYFNQGIAFGLPLGPFWILVIVGLMNLLFIKYWLKFYQSSQFLMLWPLSFIIIGSLSNFIDRLKYTGVIDFIDLWIWPAFNLADCYILVGIIWLIYLINKTSCKKI
ncbi:signal peptidase II [Patescibacteria group bacterium]|nr:signal peptidase II [Patescibacteria group bacterium]